MSDWNTLHLFDSKRFYKEIAPDFKNEGHLIDTFIQSKLYRYITRIDQIDDEAINKTKLFLKNFDTNFRFHNELYRIENKKQKAAEKYETFIQRKNKEVKEFWKKYSDEIYYYTTVLPLIMFSECAQFNPRLILGRGIFKSNISAIKGSMAKQCLDRITSIGIGGVYNDVGHIMNWLTYQDVQLLWQDITNISGTSEQSEQYYKDFINFIKIAVDNELGFISISNVNEAVNNLIEAPKLKIEIDLKKLNFVNVIAHK